MALLVNLPCAQLPMYPIADIMKYLWANHPLHNCRNNGLPKTIFTEFHEYLITSASCNYRPNHLIQPSWLLAPIQLQRNGLHHSFPIKSYSVLSNPIPINFSSNQIHSFQIKSFQIICIQIKCTIQYKMGQKICGVKNLVVKNFPGSKCMFSMRSNVVQKASMCNLLLFQPVWRYS